LEIINLAEQLEDRELKQIGSRCYDDFMEDEQSRAQWKQKHAEYLRLYYQTHKPEVSPWSGASQESIPLLTEACNQYQSRAYKAFFPSREFVQALPTDATSLKNIEKADKIAKHMNYQLSIDDRSYKPDKAQMFLATALHGSDFTKTYFDPMTGKNKVDRVRAVDLVIPYGRGPMRIDEVERKTQIIWMSENHGKILAQKGYFIKAPKPCAVDELGDPIQTVEDEKQGLTENNPYKMDNPCCVLEQHRILDLDDDGIAEPYVVWVDRQTKDVLRIQIRYEVDQNLSPTDEKKPIEYFTHYQFLTNPDGFYGNGIGHVVGQINIAVNKILRQTIDAGTLANVGNMSGFMSESMAIHGDDVELNLGTFKKVPRNVPDLQKAIYQMQFPGPNVTYIEMMRFLEQVGQRVASTTDAVTGDIQKVMQPLSILTLLESSLQLPTSVMEQQALAFEDELSKLYRLNRIFLPQSEFLIDKELYSISRDDYQDNFRIIPIIDPKMITRQQKVAKSQQVYEFVMSNPVLAQDPRAIKEATKRMLLAMDTEDVDAILSEPEVQDLQNQDLENMYFLMPPDQRPLFDVFPNQNHEEHIRKVDDLIDLLSQATLPDIDTTDNIIIQVIKGLTDEVKGKVTIELMQHRQKHVAYLYGQKMGVIDGQGQVIGMGESGSNSMVLERLIGELQAAGGLEGMQSGGFENVSGTGPSAGLYNEGIVAPRLRESDLQ
jgi:hypothetical protein